MTNWFENSNLKWYERFVVNIIKCGPVPQHIAFIMDGNRRFARKYQKSQSEGHRKGFEKLTASMQWCRHLGIKEVTVYAFSIENFKRSPKEVDSLMKLMRSTCKKLIGEEKTFLMEQGIRMRIIGNLQLLPLDLQKIIAELMLVSKDNKSVTLTLAIAYTSRDEMTSSITTILQGIENGDIDVADIDENLIDQCLFTRHSSDPDLLIRTSGDSRLSDFLLWQVSKQILLLLTTSVMGGKVKVLFWENGKYNDNLIVKENIPKFKLLRFIFDEKSKIEAFSVSLVQNLPEKELKPKPVIRKISC
jgi:ditrans,polycis-polyprenyl diphosphate synthase